MVTVGGAIAADIHGKNHHVDGSFCSHVASMTLVTPTGTRTVTPECDPDLFWATAGGMGLTGVVTEATIRMIPVETSYMLVDTERAVDLDDVMGKMFHGDAAYRYSVAWIDCQSTGSRLGRSVLTRGDHARIGGPARPAPGRPRPARAFVPVSWPASRSPRRAASSTRSPSEPSTSSGSERRRRASWPSPVTWPGSSTRSTASAGGTASTGDRGFLQYQFVVPDAEGETVRRIIERLTEVRLASFLAVLKRFGPGDPGPLSFPMPGWTLALDLPVGHHGLDRLLDDLDELVLAAGGRIYLAKDSRLAPDTFRTMYPELDRFLEVRSRVDPHGVLRSDLGRRFGPVLGRRPRLPPHDDPPPIPPQDGPHHDRRHRAPPVSTRARGILRDRPGHRGPARARSVPDGDPGRSPGRAARLGGARRHAPPAPTWSRRWRSTPPTWPASER